MSTLVIVGLMGSGKSTVGKIVASRTSRRFVDSDSAIERRTGRSVRELWELGGEAAYRELESKIVLDALAEDEPVVIAAPGGVILDPVVRAALEEPTVVWLRATPATLASRVRVGDHRPLLDDRPLEVLAAMAEARSDLYESVADTVIDVDHLLPETVAVAVIDIELRIAKKGT